MQLQPCEFQQLASSQEKHEIFTWQPDVFLLPLEWDMRQSKTDGYSLH